MSKQTDKKKSVKKTSAKPKAAAKKTAAKKAASPKKAVKKTAAKKTVTKKVAAKKTAVKKIAAKKTVAKKTAAKKTVAKKAPAKKAVAKKTAPVKKTEKVIKSKPSTKVKSTVSAKKTVKSKAAAKPKNNGAAQEVEVLSPSKKLKKVKGYNKADLAEFKKIIMEKREEIIEQLQNLKDQMMDPTTGQYVNESSPYSLHMAEQGTDAQEREKLYLWAQRENKFLGYLEDALQRIENGSYGICIDSLDLPEGPHLVPKNRLFAVPHTQHCVECKNKKK